MAEKTVFELAGLGYVGALDPDGLVAAQGGLYNLRERVLLSEALASVLYALKLCGLDRTRYFVHTRDRVRYQATQTELSADLARAGVADHNGETSGFRTVGVMVVEWGPVPPKAQLTVLPTVESVRAFPQFWVHGPGRGVAELTDCGHGYHLTDSCPSCDADQERGAAEKGRGDAEQATPEQRRALLDVVLGPTPAERQREALKAAVELAHANAQTEMRDVQEAFAADVMQLGAVRATRLWARKAMRAQTAADVWQDAVDHGRSEGPWSEALVVAEQHAVRLLRESVHPTRNAVDRALNEVQGRTAAELLDTIESFRKTVEK